MGDEEIQKIGAEFHVTPEAAERFRTAFHEMIDDLLSEFDDGEIIDYGMD